jgi:transcriptional/translational regulatory protein YebC/TACO1
LEQQGYHIIEADLQFIADNTVKLSPEDQERFSTLLEALENDEDVDAIWHNVEI